MAAISGSLDMVQLIVNEGANINAKDNDGMTPLNYAVKNGHKDVLAFLRDKVDSGCNKKF
jgi:ankyrin repeat protein